MTILHPALARALQLSEQILTVAAGNDIRCLAALDAERMQLLKSFQLEHRSTTAPNRELLARIMALNARAMGLLEHRKRGKEREMDIAAVGKRAMAAYGNVRMQR